MTIKYKIVHIQGITLANGHKTECLLALTEGPVNIGELGIYHPDITSDASKVVAHLPLHNSYPLGDMIRLSDLVNSCKIPKYFIPELEYIAGGRQESEPNCKEGFGLQIKITVNEQGIKVIHGAYEW
jgi:hypothetical protein